MVVDSIKVKESNGYCLISCHEGDTGFVFDNSTGELVRWHEFLEIAMCCTGIIALSLVR